MTEAAVPAARLEAVTLRYGHAFAIEDVTLLIPGGCMVGLIGPDGVGKSSVLSLIAGSRRIQQGSVTVLGGDMASTRYRTQLCPRVAYMPQGLGRNLYPDLSVAENIAFFSRLFGQSKTERLWRTDELLDATGLAPFAGRPAKKLSGGMRQKLGLCCSLIHDPELLILDEPTTGVDPLSRRQFWTLVNLMRSRRPSMSVLVATAYMEEAEQFDWLVAMNAGHVLAQGSAATLMASTHTTSLEEAFIATLPEAQRHGHAALVIPPRVAADAAPMIVARDLTVRFGAFTAVDHVSFNIERGEIFGFLGSNGCGKTTTMKVLAGLLPATTGSVLLFGKPVDIGDMQTRARVGYMSQSFSLYTELTVRQNLELHAHLFHLPAASARTRIADLVARFGLSAYLDQRTLDLPLGIRQRLSLAVAIVHDPEILILDEPTSGVDPLERDRFWSLLIDLSRNQGVTIFVSTHFMNEAARCDRISLMDSGRVLATDTPAALVASRHAADLEDAFIGYLEDAISARAGRTNAAPPHAMPLHALTAPRRRRAFSVRRLMAYTIRESLELIRDKVRLGFGLFGTALLMIVFGFGISTDVDNLSFAVLDRDQSSASLAYLGELRGSTYFTEKAPITSYADQARRLQSGTVSAVIEIPPGFGRDIKRGRPAFVLATIDGAMPFRAQTIRGYLQAIQTLYLADPTVTTTQPAPRPPASVSIRYKYNQNFDSIYAMVPSNICLMLALFPAILMALAIVREKELGSIINLYVTPVGRLEFLIGKQLPYVALAMANFMILLLMAIFVFQVPLKGSFPVLFLGTLIYVSATTAYGMLISAFTKTQIAALFGTAILTVLPATQFSGMLSPVSSLTGVAKYIGLSFPMTYFVPISVGTFTKGLGFADLSRDLVDLAVFVPILIGLSALLLGKQER
ncbi:ribosome-associated ATPase/putative transporter RbbA [Lichenicola sp.]|uniref:ribosome-associated ATPase/putative transporter RbbA n=1 Tax=Lichenicola sp. TaxID=2804529 RepID=UPI003B006279